MKRISLVLSAVSFCLMSMAQTMEEGKKLLRYGRLQSAERVFDALVKANPADAEANYWLGQLYIQDQAIDKAQELYSKALSATGQNPLILVGMGHVEMMQKKNEDAKARFEQAIAATAHRKNKKMGDPLILAAIGRANATGDSQTGDPDYGISKLKLAAELNPTDPDIMVDMGLLYLKKGGEYGGQAKRAYEDAIERDPNYGLPYYRIGKIFESQRNAEMFIDYYSRAVNKDPKFAPAYLAMYEYYKERDVNTAGTLLESFIANNDPDLEYDYFYADYLFRSGKYQESLNKGKEIKAALKPGEKFAKVYALFAYNYDRLGDSVQARENMERYMQEQDPVKITGDDYAMMASIYLKFPGMESKADGLVEKAVAMDTSVDNQIDIMRKIAKAYADQENWEGDFKWLNRIYQIGKEHTATEYFYLTDVAYKAKMFEESMKYGKKYAEAYPDQIQGYFLWKRAAVAQDADTSKGIALPAIDAYTQYLMRDVDNYKGRIVDNYGYKIYYYMLKTREFEKGLEAANAILAIDPENTFGKDVKMEAERLIKIQGGTIPPSSQNPSKTAGMAETGKSGGK